MVFSLDEIMFTAGDSATPTHISHVAPLRILSPGISVVWLAGSPCPVASHALLEIWFLVESCLLCDSEINFLKIKFRAPL